MNRLIQQLKRLHRDERGAEGLEKLLIIAAVALPLLGLLIFFRDTIMEWVGGKAEDVIGKGVDDSGETFNAPLP